MAKKKECKIYEYTNRGGYKLQLVASWEHRGPNIVYEIRAIEPIEGKEVSFVASLNDFRKAGEMLSDLAEFAKDNIPKGEYDPESFSKTWKPALIKLKVEVRKIDSLKAKVQSNVRELINNFAEFVGQKKTFAEEEITMLISSCRKLEDSCQDYKDHIHKVREISKEI